MFAGRRLRPSLASLRLPPPLPAPSASARACAADAAAAAPPAPGGGQSASLKPEQAAAWRERENLKKLLKWRQPHIPEDTPKRYVGILEGKDKVVIPGEGPTWFVKIMRAETADLVYNFASWDRLQDPWRNLKLFTPYGWASSDVVRRLVFPDLFFVAMVSSVLSFYNTQIAPVGIVIEGLHKTHEFLLHSNMLTLPHEPFQILSISVGLLVTFRTQSSYGRYNDGRVQWGTAIAHTREICGRILARIPTPRANVKDNPEIWVARVHGAKLAWSFPHCLKYHITAAGCNIDVDAKDEKAFMEQKRDRLRDELRLIWDFDDPGELEVVERILHRDVFNWPMAVCQELTFLNAQYYVQPYKGGLGHPNSEGLDRSIGILQGVVAETERLVQTPIYSPYTKFTNRVIYIFVCTLPPVLYPILGPWLTTPMSVYIAFVLLGIDDIGRRVEEPFSNMPVWQFVEIADQSCEQIFKTAHLLEKDSLK